MKRRTEQKEIEAMTKLTCLEKVQKEMPPSTRTDELNAKSGNNIFRRIKTK